jgi:F-type H+-transporting ATPase subunit b
MRLSLPRRSFVFALVAALVAVGSAIAANEAHDDKKGEVHSPLFVKEGDKFRPATDADLKKAGSEHEKSGGLDFTGIKRYDLGIYTLIVFGLLVYLLTKYAWPPIKEGLEKREANIRGALEEAKKDREEGKLALAEAKKQLDATALDIKTKLDEARKEADALKLSEREVGVKDAQAERERAKRELAAEKDSLVKEVYEQAVKLAMLMSEKALRRSVSAEDHARLLDESIAELKSKA